MAKRKSTEIESNCGFDVNAMLEELNKQEEMRPSQTDGPEAAHLHPGQFYDERWHMWFDNPKPSIPDAEYTITTIVEPSSTQYLESKLEGEDCYNQIASSNSTKDSTGAATTDVNDKCESNCVPDVEASNPIVDESAAVGDEVIKVIAPTDVTEVIEVTNVENQTEPTSAEPASKETSPPKATRISAKMRRASREEFCETYLKKCDTKFGKPITIEAPLMPRLYRICLLTGDRKACPTSLINNLLKKFIPIIEDEAERW